MIKVVEDPESRGMSVGAQNSSQDYILNVVTTAGESEAELYLFAIQATQPYLSSGLIRNDIKLTPRGAPNLWRVTIGYGTTGVGGGDQPLGGTGNDGGPPQQPQGPQSPQESLKGGWSFSIQAPTLHITQSLGTVGAYKRGGGAPKNFGGRIGVDQEGATIGCDIPPPARFTFKRTTARAVVTQAYLDVLSELAGRPNNAPFYFWQEGEVLFQSAEGQYTAGEGWSINWTFAVEKNDPNVIICDGLPHPPATILKYGWDYMWVLEETIEDPAQGGRVVQYPGAVYLERVLKFADFSLLEIGT